jgi:multidrug efflux pump subunit AcrB
LRSSPRVPGVAGIVVRNSIILVDFIEQRLGEGVPLADAVVDAGAVRFRPMLLTAMAGVVGAPVLSPARGTPGVDARLGRASELAGVRRGPMLRRTRR